MIRQQFLLFAALATRHDMARGYGDWIPQLDETWPTNIEYYIAGACQECIESDYEEELWYDAGQTTLSSFEAMGQELCMELYPELWAMVINAS